MIIQELGIEEMARLGATHRVIATALDLNGLAAATNYDASAQGSGKLYGALTSAAAASTTGTLQPFANMAAGQQAQFAFGYLKTPFAGTSTTDMTLQIGYDVYTGTDKAAGYSPALSVHASGSYVSYFPQEIADQDSSAVDQTYGTQESAALTAVIAATNLLIKNTRKVFTVANYLNLLFTASSANLSDLLTGEIHLYFRVVDLTKN